MPNPPILSLDLVDVAGKPLGETVDVILRHMELSEIVRVAARASGTIEIKGLRGAPEGRYRIEIDPLSYQYSSWFLNMNASGVTNARHSFAVDPRKVLGIKPPAYGSLPADIKALLSNSSNVLGYAGINGKSLYDALSGDSIRQAGLLNIIAKTRVTALTGAKTVLPSITELLEIRGDRFFARVPQTLREDTKNSVHAGLFTSVDESLHHPPDGYQHAGSFKTLDHYGNLQLTFFMNAKNDCVADIDIDDANGIEHIFQVLRNALSGEPTNPYSIHEILIASQGLDPGYALVLK